MLVPATLLVALCLMAVPNIVQNIRAAIYVEAALTGHLSLSFELRSRSAGKRLRAR